MKSVTITLPGVACIFNRYLPGPVPKSYPAYIRSELSKAFIPVSVARNAAKFLLTKQPSQEYRNLCLAIIKAYDQFDHATLLQDTNTIIENRKRRKQARPLCL
jgi:hypothetical protein